MKIGFHTDAFNSSYWGFEQCLQWAERNGVHFIECGLIDGVSWIHGLGYQPHVALYEDQHTMFIGTVQGLVMQSLLAGDVGRIRRDAPRVFGIYRRGIARQP